MTMVLGCAEETKPVIAFGPELAGIGSWEWIGADLADELSGDFKTVCFREEVPPCDVLVIVKYKLPAEAILQAAERSAVVFCPVDLYESSAKIDTDARMLCSCGRIVLHAECLRKYFQSYAPVATLDHHVKFTAPISEVYRSEGPVLWVGMRTNLPPLVDWVNANGLLDELWILTNLDESETAVEARDFGFPSNGSIRIGRWSAALQQEWTAVARAAIDIKGTDFRQRHKPPVKAVDFIASGVPVAMNRDSWSVEYLARLGFEVAAPEDRARWLSRGYWEETREFGAALRTLLSKRRIGCRFKRIIEEVLAERIRTCDLRA